MKREIRFQAVREDGRIVNPDYLDRKGVAWWKENSIPVSSDKVIFFTGLRDKDGHDIWEGDILDFDEDEWGGRFIPEVMWIKNMIGDWNYCGSLSDVSEWRKVIGNIFENPKMKVQ